MQSHPLMALVLSIVSGAACAMSSVVYCECVFHIDSTQTLSRTGACSSCHEVLTLQGIEIKNISAGSFANLSSLQVLYLSDNQLTTLPKQTFAGISSLQVLDLSGNQFTTLPAHAFAGLSSLQKLYLYGNQLTTLPAQAFAGLSSLQMLDLHGNQFTTFPEQALAGLWSLQDLHLSDNQLTTLPKQAFAGLSNLQQLYLSYTRLTTLPEQAFTGLSSLEMLELHGNQLTTLPAQAFAGLSSLSRLYLSDNELTTLSAQAFAVLSSLKVLDLSGNNLTALPKQAFAGLPSLIQLDLSNNQITELPVAVFADASSLLLLGLNQNRIRTLPAGVFDGLSGLVTLFLEHNHLEYISSDVFSGLESLGYLYLFSNQLSTLPIFPSLSNLQILDASTNRLSWLPKGVFDELNSLLTVDLAGNSLTWLPYLIFDVDGIRNQPGFYFIWAGNPLICSPSLRATAPSPSLSVCPPSCYPGSFVSPIVDKYFRQHYCRPCPPGTFSSEPGSACTACPQGSYSTGAGAVDKSTCLPCGAGRYSALEGADSLTTCATCAAGSYSALEFAGSCEQCSPGTFTSGWMSTACTTCWPGTFTSAYGVADGCVSCAPGTYGTGVGAGNASSCLACAAGTYATAAGASAAGVCAPCPAAGLYSTGGQSACLACPPGSYSTSTGSSSCSLCEAGTYASARGSTHCTTCRPGTYLPTQGAASTTACVPCDAGRFSTRAGATDASTCLECAAGAFAVSGYSACSACAEGTYAADGGSSACSLCAAGATTLRLGASAVADCVATSSMVTITMQVLLPTTKAEFLQRQDAYRAAVGATAGVDAKYVTVVNATEAARRQVLRAVQVGTSVVAGPAAAAQLVSPGALDASLAANGLPKGTIAALSVTNNSLVAVDPQPQASQTGFSSQSVGIIVGCVVGGIALVAASACLLAWRRLRRDPHPLSKEERRALCEAALTAEAVDKGSSKLCEEAYELKTGQPVQAARGLDNLLSVDAGHLHALIAKGVDGIMEEVRRLAESGGDDEKEVLELAQYILYEKASEKVYPNGIRDKARGGVDFSYFASHDKAQEARLKPAEVLALRLYTTAAYRLMNNPLRDQARYDARRACPLPVATYFAVEGIKKLRANNIRKKGEAEAVTLWRGMRNLKAADRFMEEGGTELAFMSTTTEARVAVRYSLSAHSLLFKIAVPSFMQTGADIQWLSAFPGEAEMLYPPLTYLRPTGRTEDVDITRPDGQTFRFHVVEVSPTIA